MRNLTRDFGNRAAELLRRRRDRLHIGSIVLRRRRGGIGVVAAFVASEFVVFWGAIVLLRREGLGLDISVDMARALGSAALTLLLFWWAPRLPFLIGAPLCVIVYLLCTVGLGLVRRSDIQVYRALFRKKQAAPSTTAGQ